MKVIAVIVGIFIAAGLYSFCAAISGYSPYDFSRITCVGEIFLFLWHLLGALIGYYADEI